MNNKRPLTPADIVGDVLEEYASRGVFQSFSSGKRHGAKTTYAIRWHYDRVYHCVFDEARGTLRFSPLLPEVPPDSDLYAGLKTFVKSRQAEELPPHRRIDKNKTQLRTYNRSGAVSLSLQVKDGDYEYGTRKLVNLVHEIFMSFLRDGPYLDYLVETLGLDLDQY